LPLSSQRQEANDEASVKSTAGSERDVQAATVDDKSVKSVATHITE